MGGSAKYSEHLEIGVMVERKKFAGKQKELQLTEVGRSTTNSNLLKKVDRSGTGYGTMFGVEDGVRPPTN